MDIDGRPNVRTSTVARSDTGPIVAKWPYLVRINGIEVGRTNTFHVHEGALELEIWQVTLEQFAQAFSPHRGVDEKGVITFITHTEPNLSTVTLESAYASAEFLAVYLRTEPYAVYNLFNDTAVRTSWVIKNDRDA